MASKFDDGPLQQEQEDDDGLWRYCQRIHPHAGDLQMRSPANNCRASAVSHLCGCVASRYRDAWPVRNDRLQSNNVGSFIYRVPPVFGFVLRLHLPAGIITTQLALRALAPRPEIPLKHNVEGGRRRFASGTPASGARATAKHRGSNRGYRSFENLSRTGSPQQFQLTPFAQARQQSFRINATRL